MSSEIEVSIGMPLYNDENYVREAIDSLLNQSFDQFELIISDNGSTDSSAQICKEYAAGDNRIRFIEQETNLGQVGNFNYLKDQARGKYFMWAASDDRWDKDFIKTLYEALEQKSDAVMAFVPYTFTDKEGTPYGKTRIYDYNHPNKLVRLIKFCYYGDDACFYSLYNMEALRSFYFRRWWGFNRDNPLNIAYPLICHNLSNGNFVLAGSKPMWFNRIKFDGAFHYEPFKNNYLLIYFGYFVRKVNVFFFSLQSIYNGSKSVLNTLLSIPILFIKFIWDCITPFIKIFSKIIKPSHLNTAKES